MRILVVDDHGLIREALRGVLAEVAPGAEVLDAADRRGAAEHLAGDADLDLVLLDLALPDGTGFALLADLRERHPTTGVVVLSASESRADMARALDLGALGFIPKAARREVMVSALKLVLAGGVYVPPEILGPASRHPAGMPQAAAVPDTPGLTGRQREVLALMMQGKSNKAICRALGLAEPTVKNHVTAILKALNAANRTEAVVAAGAAARRP